MRWNSANEVALNFDLGEKNMPDDLANKGPQDRTRISLLEPHEVKYWADEFGRPCGGSCGGPKSPRD
jgi:hypothetical protein